MSSQMCTNSFELFISDFVPFSRLSMMKAKDFASLASPFVL